jgi:hypothetical protein
MLVVSTFKWISWHTPVSSPTPSDLLLKIIIQHVCFLLGNSPASEFYMPTFWNTLSVPSSWTGRCRMTKFERILKFSHSKPTCLLKMERTECSETSAHKIQMPGNYPEENIQHTEHGKSLKSRNHTTCSLTQNSAVATVSQNRLTLLHLTSGILVTCFEAHNTEHQLYMTAT